MDIKACIFDLDGVIVDTAHFHFLAWKRLADELGITYNVTDNEKLKGVPRMESLELILKLGDVQLDTNEKIRLADRKNTWYQEYIQNMTPDDVLPGVAAFIKDLEEHEIRIAIASSSKNAQAVVDKIDFNKHIDALIDGTMVKKGKPDPELFILAAKELGVKHEYCIVFEDAYSGIEAARAAGMRNIGIGSAEYLDIADYVMPGFKNFNFNDLLTIFSN